MDSLIGKYQHVRSENLHGYFQEVGVPYLVRLMITNSNPEIEIRKEEDTWVISVKSLLRTTVKNFKLGEEYIEETPRAKFKSITNFEDGKLVTTSVPETGDHKTKTVYTIKEDYLIMTLIHVNSGQEGKRYFKKTT